MEVGLDGEPGRAWDACSARFLLRHPLRRPKKGGGEREDKRKTKEIKKGDQSPLFWTAEAAEGTTGDAADPEGLCNGKDALQSRFIRWRDGGYVCTQTPIHTHTRYPYKRTYVSVYMYICVWVSGCVCARVCGCLGVYARACVGVYARVGGCV